MPRTSAPFAVFSIPYTAGKIPSVEVVGSKAHHLMRMARAGLAVPPGFVLSTELCRHYLTEGPTALAGLNAVLVHEMERLGQVAGRNFGDTRDPLLVSVRSGAAISMPGMMETVLNIGLSRAAMHGLVRATGNPRLAQDCRRRLVQQYGEVVHAIPPSRFEDRLAELTATRNVAEFGELATSDIQHLCASFEEIFASETDQRFPEDPFQQLQAAIEAVLISWSSERAKTYRRLNNIPDTLGTAVTIQTMVFGNIGPNSGSGVGFTRNPADGHDALYVDFLANAQGEDVVSGRFRATGLDELAQRAPEAYRDLIAAKDRLEREFHDMQDFEFTVQDKRLLMLQARSGKRTPIAALQIATDMVAADLITPRDALKTLAGIDLDTVTETRLQRPPGAEPLATGMPASIGVAVGQVAFAPERVAILKRTHPHVILVRPSAETADIAALAEASGLITMMGARTSHAAVVARQLGKPCIVGCAELSIDASCQSGWIGTTKVMEGDTLSIDAATGEIYLGEFPMLIDTPRDQLRIVRSWML